MVSTQFWSSWQILVGFDVVFDGSISRANQAKLYHLLNDSLTNQLSSKLSPKQGELVQVSNLDREEDETRQTCDRLPPIETPKWTRRDQRVQRNLESSKQDAFKCLCNINGAQNQVTSLRSLESLPGWRLNHKDERLSPAQEAKVEIKRLKSEFSRLLDGTTRSKTKEDAFEVDSFDCIDAAQLGGVRRLMRQPQIVELNQFGLELDRNRMSKRLRLARVCTDLSSIDALANGSCPRSTNTTAQSISLYLLEQLVRELNAELRLQLNFVASKQYVKLAEIWLDIRDANKDWTQSIGSYYELLWPMSTKAIDRLSCCVSARSRSSQSRSRNQVDRKFATKRQSRQTVAKLTSSAEDSGIEKDCEDCTSGLNNIEPQSSDMANPFNRDRISIINESIKFKASKPTQTILRYSIGFLAGLIEQSILFKPILGQTVAFATATPDYSTSAPSLEPFQLPLSCQQLKLFVCVEAQKLRSMLRFVWLPKCLELALEPEVSDSSGESMARSEVIFADWKPRNGDNCKSIGLPPLTRRQLVSISSFAGNKPPQYAGLRYLNLLAMLLGQLLRNHFLSVALDRWITIVTQLRWPTTTITTRDSRSELLRLAVELDDIEASDEESEHNPSWPIRGKRVLVCNKINKLLKASMDFVVDEIASICCRLPRFEQQLELSWQKVTFRPQLKAANLRDLRARNDNVDDDDDDSYKFIKTVSLGDSILEEAKQRLRNLVDQALVPDSMEKGQPEMDQTYSNESSAIGERDSFMESGFLLALELVNLFRLGYEFNNQVCSQWEAKLRNNSTTTIEPAVVKLQTKTLIHHQSLANDELVVKEAEAEAEAEMEEETTTAILKQTSTLNCKQIRLLDMALNLIETRSGRFSHFGHLVSLDFRPFKDSLARCLQKERLILVRLELDDQVRLMERLRLQFDEIEFNIDLDAAIDEYLNERWQARQNQQPAAAEQLLEAVDMDFGDIRNENDPFELANGEQEQEQERERERELQPDISNNDNADRMLLFDRGFQFDSSQPMDTPSRREAVSVEGGNVGRDRASVAPEGEAEADGEGEEYGTQTEDETSKLNDYEQEFVNALLSGTGGGQASGQQAAVLALTSSAASSGRIQVWSEASERRLLPVIESQLHLGRLEYLARLFGGGERQQLVQTLEFAFKGLGFMCELVTGIQLEPNQLELVEDLANRASRFNKLIREACERLELARSRLNELHQLRSRVSSKLVLEFHLLMVTLGQRRLERSASGSAVSVLYGSTSGRQEPQALFPVEQRNPETEQTGKLGEQRGQHERSGQPTQQETSERNEPSEIARQMELANGVAFELDSFQENADLAQKLSMRFEFLLGQNSLLTKENRLLSRARVLSQEIDLFRVGKQQQQQQQLANTMPSNGTSTIDSSQELEANAIYESLSEIRLKILERWRHLVALMANFWRLCQEFETQQVKWLNSDVRRIDFKQIEAKFQQFQASLATIWDQFNQSSPYLETDIESSFDDRFCFDDNAGLESEQIRAKLVLKRNLHELESRLIRFEARRLPLFHLLNNRHLNERHLLQLAPHLRPQSSAQATVKLLAQCTTLNQMLELNLDRHLGLIEQLDRQAKMEFELAALIQIEHNNSNSNNFVRHRIDATSEKPFWSHLHNYAPTSDSRNTTNSANNYNNSISNLAARGANQLAEFDSWSESELALAASRLIQIRVAELDGEAPSLSSLNESDYKRLACNLVRVHSFLCRYLRLSSSLNLEPIKQATNKLCGPIAAAAAPLDAASAAAGAALETPSKREQRVEEQVKLVKSVGRLTSANQLKGTYFIELVRLFAITWLERKCKLNEAIDRSASDLMRINEHLNEIKQLSARLKHIEQTDLLDSCKHDQKTLIELERNRVKLELEKEILASKESQAIGEQREALRMRDECIYQIHRRAIPAIRAALKALDELDQRWLSSLRSYRPRPPKTIRLVIEAACILRSASLGPQLAALEPERRFDSLTGSILTDYWPAANRMLNGVHSVRFVGDLRQVGKRNLPVDTMRLIRRQYLSSPLFELSAIERVSADAARLARWLIAVDVFDRVIKVVKPNYKRYLEAEQRLSHLLGLVESRQRELELVERDLRRMDDSYQRKLGRKVAIADALDQCRRQLEQMQPSQTQLELKRRQFGRQLRRLRANESRLSSRCLLDAAKMVYLDSMPCQDERQQALKLLSAQLMSASASAHQSAPLTR